MAASRKSNALYAAGYGRLGLVPDAREPRPSNMAEGLLVHLTIEGRSGTQLRTTGDMLCTYGRLRWFSSFCKI
jgi:hypothetical protein